MELSITKPPIEKIWITYQETRSSRVAGKILGISGKTVLNQLTAAGYPIRTRGGRSHTLTIKDETILQYFKTGTHTIEETAKHFRASSTHIRNVIKRNSTLEISAISWIRENRKPNEIFDEETLIKWVRENKKPEQVYEKRSLEYTLKQMEGKRCTKVKT